MGRIYTTTGISFTNDSGGTFVDEKGLVSVNTFTQSDTINSAGTYAGTAKQVASNGSLLLELPRSAVVLFLTDVSGNWQGGAGNSTFRQIVNGGTRGFGYISDANPNEQVSVSFHSVGTYTGTFGYYLEHTADAGGTVVVVNAKISYIVLGK